MAENLIFLLPSLILFEILFFLLDAQMNEIRKNLITSLELADKYLIRLRT